MNARLDSHLNALSGAICSLETSILNMVLLDTAATPGERGLKLFNAPGWHGERVGKEFLVSQCTAINIQLEEREKCYTRVPVVDAGSKQRWFFDPMTRELWLSAQEAPCKSKLIPSLKVRNKWYKMLPHAVETREPLKLPSRLKDLTPTALPVLTGLYSSEILEAMETPAFFKHRQEAALQNLYEFADTSLKSSSSDSSQSDSALSRLTGITTHVMFMELGAAAGCLSLFLIMLLLVVDYLKSFGSSKK